MVEGASWFEAALLPQPGQFAIVNGKINSSLSRHFAG
jgi:hypothetical protein